MKCNFCEADAEYIHKVAYGCDPVKLIYQCERCLLKSAVETTRDILEEERRHNEVMDKVRMRSEIRNRALEKAADVLTPEELIELRWR